ncbi:MAG: chemotaxis protein CheR [Magnetococcales bacterium]|nr:chemotaxis protein CheR [Magnetococcales bacterium]
MNSAREASIPEDKFRQLSQFIYKQTGILMPDSKRAMLTARIQKRLRVVGLDSFTDYVDWILNPREAGGELTHFIDIVTTNKTDFFREPQHFEYLSTQVLPAYTQDNPSKAFKIWSAACSSGEEPYTMSIVLNEFQAKNQGFSFQILATDLSTRVLKSGKNGVYAMDKVAPIPMPLKKKYLLKHKDSSKKVAKMGPELRKTIRFQQLNFMDNDYGVREKMDVIFCRNAIIYFDRPTTEQIVNKFARYLAPNGFLFIGHSETLNNLKVPFKPVAPTIYQKTS